MAREWFRGRCSYCPKPARYFRNIRREVKTGAYWRDILAELFGTFILTLVQVLVVINWSTVNDGGALQTALAMGLTLVALGGALGHFGGALYNPAITLGCAIRAELTFVKAILYVLAQCLGATAAAFYALAVTPMVKAQASMLASTAPGTGVAWHHALLLEFIFTMVLVLTVLGAKDKIRQRPGFGASLMIGVSLTVGILCTYSSTGASMNPARSLGPAIAAAATLTTGPAWSHHWIYWVGPLLGAVAAAFLYTLFDALDRPYVRPDAEQSDESESDESEASEESSHHSRKKEKKKKQQKSSTMDRPDPYISDSFPRQYGGSGDITYTSAAPRAQAGGATMGISAYRPAGNFHQNKSPFTGY